MVPGQCECVQRRGQYNVIKADENCPKCGGAGRTMTLISYGQDVNYYLEYDYYGVQDEQSAEADPPEVIAGAPPVESGAVDSYGF